MTTFSWDSVVKQAERATVPPLDEVLNTVKYDPTTGVFSRVRAQRAGRPPSGCSYQMVQVGKKRYLAHRLAWLIMTGDDPAEYSIDHINGDRRDNRWCNLRRATHQQNHFNQSSRSGTSKYRGVHFSKARGKWVAGLSVNKKWKNLGYFDSEDAAAVAWNKRAREVMGEFARLNEVAT